MNYKNTASEILTYVGGESNVTMLEHCATRLRFTIVDSKKVDVDKLKTVSGVLKVLINYQVQVVIGNDVIEVYDEIMKLGKFSKDTPSESIQEKKKVSDIVLGFLIGVFAPLVPAVTGAGLLKAILMLLNTLGLVGADSTTYQLLVGLSDATFYFIPLLVSVNAAEKLNVNKLVAMACVAPLLLPNVMSLVSDNASLFGIGLTAVAYNAQVFPAMLSILFMSFVYKFFDKHSPKALRSFLVPLISMVVTFPITLLVLGPIGFYIGEILSTIVVFLYDHLGFLGVAICGLIYPIAVTTGMHKAFLPYLINSMSTIGYEIMWASASLCHNIAESGACFGIALRTKQADTRSNAITCGVSALLGITEPALYSYTLVNKKVLSSVMIGGAISGAFAGLIGLKCFAIASPGLVTLPIFTDPDNSMNIIFAIITLIISVCSSAIISFILWNDEATAITEDTIVEEIKTVENADNNAVSIKSPLSGKVVELNEVNDELFSSYALGDGLAIQPINGELLAPADGVIQVITETKHAVGITCSNGAEILMHIGIDTVRLNGKYYTSYINVGDRVHAGDLLVRFDLAEIKKEYDTIVPIVLTNGEEFEVVKSKLGNINKGDVLMNIKRKE